MVLENYRTRWVAVALKLIKEAKTLIIQGSHEFDKNGDVPGVFGHFRAQMGNSF